MTNLMISLRRFTKNKNTITIIGVIAILGLLYFGYSSQINASVKPIRIPVATTQIQPRTKITEAMVTTIEVPQISVNEFVIQSTAAIIGRYSNINALIPERSMFFKGQIVDEKDLPDSAFVMVKEGEIPYSFPVNIESTYGNSIFPGNMIDIWMKAVDSSGKVMVGRLISNVETLAVKDQQGYNVFENLETAGSPANITFGLEPSLFILLRKASYMSNFSVELFPVPHGGVLADDAEVEETHVSTDFLKNFINANTVVIEGQDKPAQKPNATDTDTKTQE